MITAIDRVGIAVKDLESALKVYVKKMGFEIDKIYVNEMEGVKTAVIRSGECIIELIQPVSEDSPVARFIEKRGEGINYVSLRVDDLENAIRDFRDKGMKVVRETPTSIEGRKYSFLHPKDTFGVLFEITE